jgi:hypothetical protein
MSANGQHLELEPAAELDTNVQLDPEHVLAIIREEAPHVLELAVRRAVIEQQREVIARLHAALGEG